MSTERFTLFQETSQTSSAWIRQIADTLGIDDEQQAYHLLRSTLWALRDRLLPDDAVDLAAQLPVLIRGLYYEGWRLADVPVKLRSRGDFLQRVAAHYRARPLPDLEAGVRAVLSVLGRNIDFGETFALLRVLPEELRDLWPEHMVHEAERRDAGAGPGPGPGTASPPLH